MGDLEPIYVRPSTVTSHALCPARTGLRDVEGANHHPNEALLFGSGVHWCIEQTLRFLDFTTDDLAAELHELFVKDVPEGIEPVKFSTVANLSQRRTLTAGVMNAWDLWRQQVQPELPKTLDMVEQTLEMHIGVIDGREVILRGTPDVIYLREHLVIDWKTAGRQWSADKAEGQLQRVAYPMMARLQFNTMINKFDFWVFDRSNDWWGKFSVPSGSREAERAFVLNAMQVASNEVSGRTTYTPSGGGFKSRGWHCSPQYCDAWSVCDGKFLVADGRADEVAPTLKERWSE